MGTDCKLRFVEASPDSPDSAKFASGNIPPPPGSSFGCVSGVDDDSLLILIYDSKNKSGRGQKSNFLLNILYQIYIEKVIYNILRTLQGIGSGSRRRDGSEVL